MFHLRIFCHDSEGQNNSVTGAATATVIYSTSLSLPVIPSTLPLTLHLSIVGHVVQSFKFGKGCQRSLVCSFFKL
jgi:hypothetical protein